MDILGYAPDEIRGQNLLKVPTLPLESRLKGMRMLARRIAGREIPPYVLDFITKSGKRMIGEIRAKELKDESGKVVGDLVMITDVTESKREEPTPKEDH